MTNPLVRDTASLRAWVLLRSGNKLDLVAPRPVGKDGSHGMQCS